ncbi:MAG: hypothetical protein ACYS8K_09605 [Planctomycetota bacterium]|jgi:hypothetical protein
MSIEHLTRIVTLYHRTSAENARSIFEKGFRDGMGSYGVCRNSSGVWLCSAPRDISKGPAGDVLLEVTLDLDESALAPYEWIDPDKPYREWLVPADLLNEHMVARLHSGELD